MEEGREEEDGRKRRRSASALPQTDQKRKYAEPTPAPPASPTLEVTKLEDQERIKRIRKSLVEGAVRKTRSQQGSPERQTKKTKNNQRLNKVTEKRCTPRKKNSTPN